MTLEQFLAWLLTAAGAGAVTFGLIQFVDKLVTLPSGVKFYGAMALSFIIPLLAYGAEVGLHLVDIGWNGVFAAVAVGYMVSQTVHRQIE